MKRHVLSRLLGLFVLIVGLVDANCLMGQDAATSVAATEVTPLRIGDQAPPLAVDHWLGGTPVEAYAKDNFYVVEFWATWCSPCIKSMPHLSELADRYAKQGLVVVAMTRADEANTRESIEQFITGPGKDFRFQYAMCESDIMQKSYMEATGQQGIPCSFVIDRDGKLAYVGHPHDLDYVLDRLVAGKWRGKADADELREMNESIPKLGELAQSDPEKALQIAEHIRRANPQRAKSLDFAYVEMLVLCQQKMFDRAKATIETMTGGAEKTIEWGSVATLSGVLASKELNPERLHRDFAISKMEAAEIALKDDWQNLLQVGVAYQFSGEKARAKVCIEKAIELCPDEQVKNSLRALLETRLSGSAK